MKKEEITVGIITMHKVFNYGSALQALALQEVVSKLGYKTEIIDYIYPNPEHQLYRESIINPTLQKENIFIRLKNKIVRQIHSLDTFSPKANSIEKFQAFYQSFLHLTPTQYPNRYILGKTPPIYDIYLTGSDQVWNSKYIGYDTSFMFSFARDSHPRLSYGASFAGKNLPAQFQESYSNELKKYLHISVRERSGSEIIKSLLNKSAKTVCDPTLLLTKEQWLQIASASDYKITESYILIFVLDYAYNPYPAIYSIIENLHKKLKKRMLVLHGKISNYMKKEGAILIEDAGPLDFIKLFTNASFVITTSFHGTAFSLNFEIPFYSVIQKDSNEDSRMHNLLKMVGAEANAISCEEGIDLEKSSGIINKNTIIQLANFRNESFSYLENALTDAKQQLNQINYNE